MYLTQNSLNGILNLAPGCASRMLGLFALKCCRDYREPTDDDNTTPVGR